MRVTMGRGMVAGMDAAMVVIATEKVSAELPTT
jgi:hypothetical protein